MIVNNHNSLNIEEVERLNDMWKKNLAPQVHVQNSSERETYRFGDQVAKIKSFQQEGKTICLLIARTPWEKLPSDLNESKENEIWVSLDITMHSTENNSRLIDSNNLDNRIYLWLNVNQQQGIEAIQGLFDKIVIDQSSARFFEDNYAKRFSILFHTPQSIMITEDPTKFFYSPISLPSTPEKYKFLEFTYDTFFNFQYVLQQSNQEDAQMFMENIARQETEKHFTQLFENVIVHTGKQYPYSTACGAEGKKYFVLSHPKSTSLLSI